MLFNDCTVFIKINVMNTQCHVCDFMQANPTAPLDLSDYHSQELLVSFAVVNDAGMSNFSLATYILVDEGKA